MKLLVVVDMQTDFVNGALGTPEAIAIVPAVQERIRQALADGWEVVFTQDTHQPDYLATQEGKNLPVEHCIRGGAGWQLIPELLPLAQGCRVFEKPAFGSPELAAYIREAAPEEAELIGLCTDICVISNALLIKAACPELLVSVRENCCAGVSPATHQNALEAMKICQVAIR